MGCYIVRMVVFNMHLVSPASINGALINCLSGSKTERILALTAPHIPVGRETW